MVEVARTEAPPTEYLSQKTINRHISAVSGLFSWAAKHGEFDGANPARGFIEKKSGGSGPARRPWRGDELEILFSTPAWKGEAVARGAYFFVPLIALFSGMRREEICKLNAKHIRQPATFG
jgi:integrase